MTDAELNRIEDRREAERTTGLRQPRNICPKCGGDSLSVRHHRAPGIEAPDYTCAWQECHECDYKTEPA